MLPRILIIDDQFARDKAEQELFLLRLNAIESVKPSPKVTHPVAEVVYCSGQQVTGNTVNNDYRVIREAVASGWAEESPHWSLVMLDVRFDSGATGPGGLPEGQPEDEHFGEVVRQYLKRDFSDLPVVMLSGKRQQELAERDTPYLSKDGLNEQAFRRCLLRHGLLSIDQIRHLLGLPNDVVVLSDSTLACYREAFVHARGNVSVLILGETGTGKEVLANYIHECSGRQGPFIGVNVAAIPKDLLESELFGIEKGIATGVSGRRGKFEQANGGTLFLDEIGDMPLDAQVKVLRALQEKKIYRVGGEKAVELDVRLLCATSRNLAGMIEQGAFREDLYYRINTIQLELPPLRKRQEEIAPLARVFLEKASRAGGKAGLELSKEAVQRLETHAYPGNVRELENIVSRLASGAGSYQVLDQEMVSRALESASGFHSAPDKKENYRDASDGSRGYPNIPNLTLKDLPDLLSNINIEADPETLRAAKLTLDVAFQEFLQRVAGAALECCRDPVTGSLNRQRAMQLLTGNQQLKGKEPARTINRILGRPLAHTVSDQDLEYLIDLWKTAASRQDERGIKDGRQC